jgi:hypothetical protein
MNALVFERITALKPKTGSMNAGKDIVFLLVAEYIRLMGFGSLRTRALRVPVFVGSLMRKIRRCAPPPPHRVDLTLYVQYMPPAEIHEHIEKIRKNPSLGENQRTRKALSLV